MHRKRQRPKRRPTSAREGEVVVEEEAQEEAVKETDSVV